MKIKAASLFFSFFFLLNELVSLSQINPIIAFSEEDGLACNYIRDIVKDKKGNLWIATDNGLSKYYGCDFHNYYKADGLPNNSVWALAVTDNNTIYAGCYHGGLAEIKDNKVVGVYNLNDKKFKNSFRTLFYSNNRKLLLAGTDYGVFVFKDSVLIPVKFKKTKEKKHSILSFTEYDSRIFFTVHGADPGIYKMFFHPDSTIKYTAKRLNPDGIFASAVLNDNLYFTHNSRIYAYSFPDTKNAKLISETDSRSIIWDMVPYDEHELLMGCYNDGRFKNNSLILNVRTGKLTVNPDHIPAMSVQAVFADTANELLWYGTDEGLYCSYPSPFTVYSMGDNRDIKDIILHHDSLMVLTKDQLLRFDNGKFIPVVKKKEVLKKVRTGWEKISKNKKIQHDLFTGTSDYSMNDLENDGDKLFIRTSRGSVSVPDLKTYYPFGLGVFKRDEFQGLYVQTLYRPVVYFPSTDNFYNYSKPKGERGEIKDVIDIVSSGNVLYFASYFSGLYVIKDKKIYYLNNDINSEFDDQIMDIAKDKNGRVWCISTQGNLMNVTLENDNLILKRKINYTNSGIIGKSYKWLIFNDDYLFLASNKGLNILSYRNLYADSVRTNFFFNKYNGYEFLSARDPLKDKEGNILVHTQDKIISISSEFRIPSISGVEYENIFVNSTKVNMEDISERKLPYSTNRISFNFNVIKYPTAKNVKYRYRINKGKWINDNLVILHSLREGNYTIDIEVRNLETNTEYYDHLSFSITKPFWQTWWFIFYLVILITFVVFWTFRVREMRLKKFHEEKTRLIIHNSELKLRSLQLQMNPHFLFNSLTSIQGFILMNNEEDALRFIDDLASILRTSLENASKDYIPLSEEIEFLKTFAEIEQFRHGDKLEINFINELKKDTYIPPMLIQPLIENAIKHGISGLKKKGVIDISFFDDDGIFTISVKDNGIGRSAAKKNKNSDHSGKALSIIRERLELLNEKNNTDIHRIKFIDLEKDGLPAGTEVLITLLFIYQEEKGSA